MAELTEIKETQEQIAKLLHDFQVEHKASVEENKHNAETLKKMQDDFAAMTDENQKLAQSLESEEKARQELELAIARMREAGGESEEAKGLPEYRDAFIDYMATRKMIDPEINEKEFKALVNMYAPKALTENEIMGIKTLLVGSNPDGGYLVPVERSSRIIKRIFETSPVRAVCTVETTATEAKEYVLDDDEFSSEKVGELDTRGETDTAQIGIVTIPTKEQVAEPRTTQKNLDDSTWDVDSWITKKLSEVFTRVENHEALQGSGANEMAGICTYPDWATLGVYERNALETRNTTGAAGAINPDDLIDVQSDLLEYYQPNARWMLHRKLWAEIMKLKDSDNQYLLNPQMLFAGVAPQLLGKPVVLAGDMADSIESDAIVALYGDFREGYVILDRIGIRVLRDPYTTKGVVKFYTTKRTGGGVVNFQAIKRLSVPSDT